MKWKENDHALMKSCMDTILKTPIEVVILNTNCEGQHPIKAADRNGMVFYCADSDLREMPGQSNTQIDEVIRPCEIKVPKTLPTFQEIERCFLSLYRVLDQCEGSADASLVVSLAKRSLYEDIKLGCRWEE